MQIAASGSPMQSADGWNAAQPRNFTRPIYKGYLLAVLCPNTVGAQSEGLFPGNRFWCVAVSQKCNEGTRGGGTHVLGGVHFFAPFPL